MNAVHVQVVRARTPWARLKGLLGAPPLPPGHGLLLERCRAVHTVGMTRAIDVVFVGPDGSVLDLRRGLGAGRVAVCRRATSVLELAAGDAWRLGMWRGCRLHFVDRGVTP
ncbi:MAG: DUF192 domain-containing protein [Burkholderiaceae bacterium]|jgi:uncharacterized membrane protein (UPF0127 family)|nr:DUF192 domain-containing protein [Burkholderiales bacterium]MCZ8104756.1 DUF192 domain-containing protein [Burkholderiales bacterium]MCZ8337278.1 DUF192 domain-containing protein [Burkholderiaceae bacterium]